VDHTSTLRLLREGELEVQGRMPYSSNATLLVRICHEGEEGLGIYKPHRGERPLWDFPPGLGVREAAAFELAQALGWDVIPPTVLRDGPLGEGSVQHFVDADFEQHHFTLVEDEAHHPALQRLCLLDVVANNTDRKSGHCLVDADGRIWGIDNGLSFHEEFKLRTVIWEFSGDAIPDELLDPIAALVEADQLPEALAELLTDDEQEAMLDRAGALLRGRHFPTDPSGRRWPWPLV
jgi:uncharacterized repeat protein (TIGR03843 family)